ncbi:MAG: thioredoxin family protein [Armatimonadota bacterium]|nr:thioredoxin family protein [bacterium]
MNQHQRKILTVVLTLVVVAAAVGGGILAIQGSRQDQRTEARQAKAPECPAPTMPHKTILPPMMPQSGAGPAASESAATAAETQSETQTTAPSQTQESSEPKEKPAEVAPAKIKFIELFAEWCGPCKSMKPIIEELKKEYKDKVEFETIDIDKNKDAAKKYSVSAIPVQLIFQGDKQVFKHVGSIPKADIVAEFKKLGL